MPDALVVVAYDCGNLSLADGGDDFVREGAVADEVAKTVKVIVQAVRRHVGEDGFQGGQVGVNVAEDSNLIHRFSFPVLADSDSDYGWKLS